MKDKSLWEDPIVEEVRATREKHARKFGYNPKAIIEDLRKAQLNSSCTVVSFPPRRIVRASEKAD